MKVEDLAPPKEALALVFAAPPESRDEYQQQQ
jgi:hypothetical protein